MQKEKDYTKKEQLELKYMRLDVDMRRKKEAFEIMMEEKKQEILLMQAEGKDQQNLINIWDNTKYVTDSYCEPIELAKESDYQNFKRGHFPHKLIKELRHNIDSKAETAKIDYSKLKVATRDVS